MKRKNRKPSRLEAQVIRAAQDALELIGSPEEKGQIRTLNWPNLIDTYIGNGLFLMMLENRDTPLTRRGWGMFHALRHVVGEVGWQRLMDDQGERLFGLSARTFEEFEKQERDLRSEAKRLGMPRRFTQ